MKPHSTVSFNFIFRFTFIYVNFLFQIILIKLNFIFKSSVWIIDHKSKSNFEKYITILSYKSRHINLILIISNKINLVTVWKWIYCLFPIEIFSWVLTFVNHHELLWTLTLVWTCGIRSFLFDFFFIFDILFINYRQILHI